MRRLRTVGLFILAGSRCTTGESGVRSDPSQGRIDATPIVSIGAAEADPLFGVVGAAVLDGMIVVANSGSYELRFYGLDGRLVRTTGRQGDGPGEFRAMAWLQEADGGLFVYDQELHRVSRFDRQGVLQGSTQVHPTTEYPTIWAVGVLPDGGILCLGSRQLASAPPKGSVYRDTVALLRYTPNGLAPDSIGAYLLTERYADTFGRTGHVMWDLPGGRASAIVVSGWRYYTIENDAPVVQVYDVREASGDEWRAPAVSPPAITARDRAVLRARLLPAALPNRRDLAEIVDHVPIPGDPPPFGWIGRRSLSMLRVTREGAVWALRFGGTEGSRLEWVIFDSAGGVRRSVASAEELDVLYADSGSVLVRRWDEVDAETIELRRVVW